jgi:hypothetical protein
VGSLRFGTTGTSSSEKRAASIFAQLSADSTTNVSGDLIFSTTNTGTSSEKVRITAGGNVGIGTATPGYPLEVASGSSQYPQSIVIGPSTHATSRRAGINIDQWQLGQDLNADGTKDFYIWENLGAAARLFINTAGNVGIGTTTPTSILHTTASGAKTAAYTGNLLTNTATSGTASIVKTGLDVQSTGIWNGATATNVGLNVNATGGTTNYAAIFSGGNVGIGTTAPAGNLAVATDGGGSSIYITSAGGASSGSPRMMFQSYRGTFSSPTYPLDGDLLGQFLFNNHTGNSGAMISINAVGNHGAGPSRSGGRFDFWTTPSGTNNIANRMSISDSGNVGIGTTTPLTTLDISGDVRATGLTVPGPTSGKYMRMAYDTSGDYGDLLSFDASTSTTMAMQIRGNPVSFPSGNVGIGTTSPSYTLHVVGTAGLSTGTAWTNASDRRLKDIHGDYEYGLNEILKLHPVRYSYKKDNPLGLPSDFNKTGFIAQEVEKVIPDAVSKREDGFLELNVDPIHWAVVNAIKDLYRKYILPLWESDKKQDQKIAAIIERTYKLSEENAQIKMNIEMKDKEIAKLKKNDEEKDKKISNLQERMDKIEKLLMRK